MRCDFYIIFKLVELALAITCATFKGVTDDEGYRLQIILRKLSQEWPLLNSITRDEHGSSLADVTYGGYVIICTGLLAGQLAGELRYPIMECFFLGLGVLLYSILGGLELASIELLRPELVDNAGILGGLSLIMALVFIFDIITGSKRRKRQQMKVDHYWKGMAKPTMHMSTSTRGTQTDSDMEDEDEIISIASFPPPPASLDVTTKLPSTFKRRVLSALHLLKYGSPHTQESAEEPFKWAAISSLGGGIRNGTESPFLKPPIDSLFSNPKPNKDTLQSCTTFPWICAADRPTVALTHPLSVGPLPTPLPITFLLPVYSIAAGSWCLGTNIREGARTERRGDEDGGQRNAQFPQTVAQGSSAKDVGQAKDGSRVKL